MQCGRDLYVDAILHLLCCRINDAAYELNVLVGGHEVSEESEGLNARFED